MPTNSKTTEKHATAEKATPAAPQRGSARKAAIEAKKPGQRRKATMASPKRETKARPQTAANTATVRAGSKSAKILELVRRASGATLAEIEKATGWQQHSIRGFLSTTMKKHHIKIDSSKNGAGQRVYRVIK